MKIPEVQASAVSRPLRLWPGVAAGVLQWLAMFGLPRIAPDAGLYGIFGSIACGAVIVVWWLFFSRVPLVDRWVALALIVVSLIVAARLTDESTATAGMGILLYLYAIPVSCLALVVWAVASGHLPVGTRRAALVASILLSSGFWTLVRIDGVTGGSGVDFAWRWTPTPEELMLDTVGDEPMVELSVASSGQPHASWPGFRGPGRDGIVRGVSIETDWTVSPPVELWRRPIGPGWSSFAFENGLLYTQEQRGDEEIVAAYEVTTGLPVWQHRDATRFWEANGGAGPRATPTLDDGRIFSFGGTGIVNALDSTSGSLLWSRNAEADTGSTIPFWGYSSSPLVVGGLVVIASGNVLIAYDKATGESSWLGPSTKGGESYSSPHLATIDGVEQILLMSGAGAASVAPADGTVLWQYPWPGAPIVQPAVTAGGDILLTTAGASGALGLRRVGVSRGPDGWEFEERWMSNRLKPYFNDFVLHQGHAYGFDGSILACIDLDKGERQWKGGRYGNGQMVLLSEQNLLLVLSEEGEVALVSATPDQFVELARFPAIDGKTWNHPVLVDDLLLVRNGEEMAAFRLP